jgi:hypothetical protein
MAGVGMGRTVVGVVGVVVEQEGKLVWEHTSKVLSIDHRPSLSHRSTNVNLSLSLRPY